MYDEILDDTDLLPTQDLMRMRAERDAITSARKALGVLFRESRKRCGYTQDYLAAELGLLSGQSIANFERGIRAMPKRHLDRIVDLLGLNHEHVSRMIEDIEMEKIKRRNRINGKHQ